MVQLTISSSKPVGGRSLNFTVDVAADATIRNVKGAIASKYPKVREVLGWLPVEAHLRKPHCCVRAWLKLNMRFSSFDSYPLLANASPSKATGSLWSTKTS